MAKGHKLKPEMAKGHKLKPKICALICDSHFCIHVSEYKHVQDQTLVGASQWLLLIFAVTE